MVHLAQAQADALLAFLESFDLNVTGAWPAIEKGMREDFGIEEPERMLEQAREVLQGVPDVKSK